MARSVKGTAKAIEKTMQAQKIRYRSAMITLTYRDDVEWGVKDISKLTNHYRMWAERRNIVVSGVWVLEQTKRGRPHYHMILFIPRGYTPPMPDKQGWWTKGMTEAKWARRPVGYIAKYASKLDSVHELPSGARLHGYIGLSPSVRLRRAWYVAPKWLTDLVPQGHGIRRVEGWWRDLTTGIEYRSPWVIDSWGGGTITIKWWGWEEGENYRFT